LSVGSGTFRALGRVVGGAGGSVGAGVVVLSAIDAALEVLV